LPVTLERERRLARSAALRVDSLEAMQGSPTELARDFRNPGPR
jgi:hypothetical protein